MAEIACIYHGRIRNIEKHFQTFRIMAGPANRCVKFTTKKRGDGMLMAESAIQQGCTHLISIGGDGTLNEVVNGLMKAKRDLPSAQQQAICLGALPFGTGNDFLRTIGARPSPESLIRSIHQQNTQNIDLGRATFSVNGNQQERFFLNIADLGMGGVIAERLHRYPGWLGKRFTYPLAIVRTFLSFRHHPARIHFGQDFISREIMSIVVANGKYFGAGLGIAPDADLQDGQLELVVIGNISLWDYLGHLSDLRKCLRIDHPEVEYSRVSEVEIRSERGRLPIDIDGEYVGDAPVRIDLVARAIRWIEHLPKIA